VGMGFSHLLTSCAARIVVVVWHTVVPKLTQTFSIAAFGTDAHCLGVVFIFGAFGGDGALDGGMC